MRKMAAYVGEWVASQQRVHLEGNEELNMNSLSLQKRERFASQSSTLSSSSGEIMLSSASSWNHSENCHTPSNNEEIRAQIPQAPLPKAIALSSRDVAESTVSREGYKWLLRQSKRRQHVNPSLVQMVDTLPDYHEDPSNISSESIIVCTEALGVDPMVECALGPKEENHGSVKADTMRKAMQCKHNLESMYVKHQTRRYERMRRQKELEDEMDRQDLQEAQREHLRAILCQKESEFQRLSRVPLTPAQFSHIQTIGSGAFGEVSLVKNSENQTQYAMKRMDKFGVVKRNHVRLVQAEKEFLCRADSEWVVKLYYSLQDAMSLYLVMEYLPSGDLLGLMSRNRCFTEDISRFYLLEIVAGVNAIHDMGIIHRDLKGENVLIGADGHLKITDFGLCCSVASCEDLKRRKPVHAMDVVGTPSFVAPEVLLREPYTRKCDWWSVGVLAFQMMTGAQPFLGSSSRKTCYKVAHWWNFLDIPDNLSLGARSFIAGMLCDQSTRMDFDAIKGHMLFKGLAWDRTNPPPYIPGKLNHVAHSSGARKRHNNKMDQLPSDRERIMCEESFRGYEWRRFWDGSQCSAPPSLASSNFASTSWRSSGRHSFV